MTGYQKGTVRVIGSIGTSDTGKTGVVKGLIRKERPGRLLVWDPNKEWGDFGRVFSDAERVQLVDYCSGARTFKAVYQPGFKLDRYRDRFDWLCRLAFALRDLWFHVDELPDVTTPSYAPSSWRACTKKGGHAWLTVSACAQFPANIDKDFLANCTELYCGRIFEANAAEVMRRYMGSDLAALAALPDGTFLHRNMKTGAPAARRVIFKPKRTAA